MSDLRFLWPVAPCQFRSGSHPGFSRKLCCISKAPRFSLHTRRPFGLLKEFAASENVQSGDTTFGGCIGVAVAIDYEFCGCYKESREPQQDNTVIKGACIGMQNRGCHRALVFSFACIVSCVCANVTVVTDVFCLMLLEHIMMSSRRQLGSFPCMPIVQYRVQVVNCAMRAVAIRQF